MTQFDGSRFDGGSPPAFARFAFSARTRGRQATAQTIRAIIAIALKAANTTAPTRLSGSFRGTNHRTIATVKITRGPRNPR